MRLPVAIVALLIAGCVTSPGVPQEVRAVSDFVDLTELERVDNIRLYRQLHYTYVNDYFVTVSAGERHYLVEFQARCRALMARAFTASVVDYRYDPNYLRVRDTIRGCSVSRIYEATPEQLLEIKALSKSEATGAMVPKDS